VFASFPFLGVDLFVVGVAQVDSMAAFFRDGGCKCYLDAGFFNLACGIVCACSLDVRAMGENAARDIFEAIPLFKKIISYVITDLVD
jgi:alpha-glucuronidase